MAENFYDFEALDNRGNKHSMNEYKGKTVLVVNTASKCGFTPQYDGLQKLYEEYKDQGLEIIGFPCDQFANQEPGSNEEIAEFCKLNFGVTFPIYSKIEVNGDDAHPIYKYLKSKKPGLLGGKVKWNFTKFLINSEGKPVKRFAPTITPENLVEDILKAMKTVKPNG